MNKQEILAQVHELLNKAEIPIKYQSSKVASILDNSHYDMELKMEFRENCVRGFCHERGVMIFEKYIKDPQLVIYLMINEVIASYYTILATREHVGPDNHIDMEWERNEFEKAYERVGEPYLEIYKKRLNMFNIADCF